MSRYTVDTGIDVGFDPPTNVFFGQKFDEEDELVDECESHHLIVVVEWVQRQGYKISYCDLERLLRDQVKPWTPGPLQKALGFEGRP